MSELQMFIGKNNLKYINNEEIYQVYEFADITLLQFLFSPNYFIHLTRLLSKSYWAMLQKFMLPVEGD